MNNLNIAFFEVEPWEKEYLEKNLKSFNLNFYAEKFSAKNLKEATKANVISTFIYSQVDKKSIEALKNLKYITTRSTGFDHIDLKACQRKNILASNVPTYGENTVAEHTFALILALSRKIYPSLERTKKGDFSLDLLRGFDLKGKTLGVVGVGNIGRHVIRMARGFDMEVIAFDLYPDKKFAKDLAFKYATLDEVFKKSDIVTLHVPYNKATHHLIDQASLKKFKPGCYLINTSRGGICDTSALLKGLHKNIFAGLALDTLEEESFIKEERELLSSVFKKDHNSKTVLENHILLNQPNVIITPHNAFNSQEALQRILDTTIENIKAFAGGKSINLIK